MAGHNGWGHTGGRAGSSSKGEPLVLPALSRDDVRLLAFGREMLKLAAETGEPLVSILMMARGNGFIEGDDAALAEMAQHLAAVGPTEERR